MSDPRPISSLRQDAFNLPNSLTFLRIALIPVFLVFLADEDRLSCFYAAMIYVVSAITDALDGWLARRQNLESLLGKFLDPLADKVLVMSALIFMVGQHQVASWIVIVMVSRELAITALRAIAMSEGVAISAGDGGKQKTALQMVALLMLILRYPYVIDFGFVEARVDFHELGLAFLYVSLLVAITSAGEYLHLFARAVEAKAARKLD